MYRYTSWAVTFRMALVALSCSHFSTLTQSRQTGLLGLCESLARMSPFVAQHVHRSMTHARQVARSSGSPSAYSVEWAVVVTAQLKKILAEIVLPASTQRLGLGIKSTFRGILFEPDSRARWTARFTYLFVTIST
jgi:hypothetical protein